MKSIPLRAIALVIFIFTLSLPSLRGEEEEFQPIPAQISNRAVMMKLPEGVRRVRLRTRNADGLWQVHTIAHLHGTEGHLKLRLPDGVAEQNCEVAISWSDPFPKHAYEGTSKHVGTTSSLGIFYPSPLAGVTSYGSDVLFDDAMVRTSADAVAAGTPDQGETAVVESDIWKWRDRTLYFFNQYRGLQAIDASDPAAPSVLATHSVNSYGEQLYLHPEADLVMLLAHDRMSGNGRVDLVSHESPEVLEAQASFPLSGRIIESRLVGKILYVVSQSRWEKRVTDEEGVDHITLQQGLAVNKFDLSNPDDPVASEPIYLGNSSRWNFWNARVQASATALLISTDNYDSSNRRYTSTVHVVDISAPSQAPQVTHHYPTAGRVLNKFNMHLKGDILTVVSQVQNNGRSASVETFDLSLPDRAIGSVSFAANETITATRFVGDLLYVVTFLRIDPLFVVDLKDPKNLRILSELEIPGFSTYLTPLNDEALISIGVEGRQIAVSWFDVSDPTDTSLASRVFIGGEDTWAWSEANWDEKAFGFYPDDNLILVPYRGSVPDRGWVNGVQLVELGDGELIKRGAFEHEFQARRARVLGDAVVSISERSLRSLDISDRDNPRLLAELPLAWPAELVHRFKDTLVQIELGSAYSSTSSKLHLSSTSDPNTLRHTLELPVGDVGGTLQQGDFLYLAQTEFRREEDGSNTTHFKTTVIDLSDPNLPVIAGSASHPAEPQEYYLSNTSYEGAILPDGTLLWYQSGSNSHWSWARRSFWPGSFGDVVVMGMDMLWWSPPAPKRVYTADISDNSHPTILATAELATGNNPWAGGEIRIVGSTLYHGLEESESIELEDGVTQWINRHYLSSLDLSDPDQPVTGKLVSLPGIFEHAAVTATGGTLIFSSNRLHQENGQVRSFQSLAYDGLNAFLLDELLVSEQGLGAHKLFEGSTLVHQVESQLFVYGWDDSGQFQRRQILEHPDDIHEMAFKENLLVLKGRELTLVDFSNPTESDPSSISFPIENFWKPLNTIEIHERAFAYLPLGFQGVRTLDLEEIFDPMIEPRLLSLENSGNEWQRIPLASLPMTMADRALMGEALSDTTDWFFCDQACMDYHAWARKAFRLSPGDPVPSFAGDSDRDGKTNGWEYLTGSDPGDARSGIDARVRIELGKDGRRSLCSDITINPSATASTRMIPEVSYDLLNWTSSPNLVEIADGPSLHSPGLSARIHSPVGHNRAAYLRWIAIADDQGE